MKKRRVLFAVLAVAALLVAACGSDRGEDESGGAEGGATGTTEAAVGGAGDFGDLAGVCGPNEAGGELSTAGPEETQGVTEGTITVGTVSDPGFEGRPGLNQEIFDTGEAFVEWCNAAGGINGRQLELNLHDAAITEYQPVMADACQTDFGIIGSGAVQDNFWPDAGAACGLIDIAGFSVTTQKAGLAGRDAIAARSVQPVPNAGDRFQVGSFLTVDAENPDAMARSGIVYGDLDTLIAQKDKTVAALEEIGHTFVHESAYNILGEANWAPFAAALQEDDVQFLHFVGEGENFALLVQAMDEIDYRPDLMLMETNLYDQNWVEAAGAAADGVYVRTVFWPFEEADQNPATQQYLNLLDRVRRQGGPARRAVHVVVAAVRPVGPTTVTGTTTSPAPASWRLRPRSRTGPAAACTPRPHPAPTSRHPAPWSCRSRTGPSPASPPRRATTAVRAATSPTSSRSPWAEDRPRAPPGGPIRGIVVASPTGGPASTRGEHEGTPTAHRGHRCRGAGRRRLRKRSRRGPIGWQRQHRRRHDGGRSRRRRRGLR